VDADHEPPPAPGPFDGPPRRGEMTLPGREVRADHLAVPRDVVGVTKEPVVDEHDAMAADDLEERLAVQIDVLVPSQPNEPDVEAPALQRVEDVVRGSCRAVREHAAAREDRQ